jgi:hypothetical protein
MKLSDNLLRVFSKPENDYEGFKKFVYDYTHGNAVFDENGDKVTSAQSNEKINAVCFDILGFDAGYKPTKRELKKAMKKNGLELFEVLEEAIDFKVATGFEENEFFNEFVEKKNISAGDRNEYWSDKDIVLTVAKVSGDHHDLTMQKLGEGESFSVKTSNYAIKVGMDIDVYLLGRKDWSEFVDAVSTAFQEQVQNDMFTAFVEAEKKMPTQEQFVITEELDAAHKDDFDELLADVSMANKCDVIIMGLKTDLKKLTKLADIDWISEDQKKEVASLGRLGSYEGTTLIELPNRFVKNDVTKKLITAGTLYIIPNVDNKFVKFVDVGETEIVEVSDKGDRNDDFMTYEVQREMGVAVVIDRYHGVFHIA